MTMLEIALLFSMPVAGLLIAGVVFYLTPPPAR